MIIARVHIGPDGKKHYHSFDPVHHVQRRAPVPCANIDVGARGDKATQRVKVIIDSSDISAC